MIHAAVAIVYHIVCRAMRDKNKKQHDTAHKHTHTNPRMEQMLHVIGRMLGDLLVDMRGNMVHGPPIFAHETLILTRTFHKF